MQAANRVAVNTIIQYVRLILNVLIGLISVRLILNALGEDDYGIYDVVAGVISLIGFISSSLNQTSLRFISVSIGKNDNKEVLATFNNCFWLHLFIAFGLSLLLEIIGLFLFDGFLNIAPDRIYAARCVYHFMVITLFLNIAITPLNALIIAHEKFIFVAGVSILDSLLKLAIALALIYTHYDKLILYGFLMAAVTGINVLLDLFYVRVHYRNEMSLSKPSLSGIKEVTGFAGWTLLDVIGSAATRQGYTILINKYFGTTINAVFALARQVEGHIYTISTSVIDTMKPQIMKSYGAGDSRRMLRLSMTAGKFGFSMMSLVAIPLIVCMPFILDLWLVNVPEGLVLFTRLLVIACMCEQITKGLVFSCQATGNIKWMSVVISSLRFLALPLSWLAFELGHGAASAIFIFVICESIGSFGRVIVMSKLTDLSIKEFVNNVLVRVSIPFFSALFVCYALNQMNEGLLWLAVEIVASVIVYGGLLYFIGLTTNERHTLVEIFKSITSKLVHR